MHGHAEVPSCYKINVSFGNWVDTQRKEMFETLKKRDRQLVVKGIEALMAIQFFLGNKVKEEQVRHYLEKNWGNCAQGLITGEIQDTLIDLDSDGAQNVQSEGTKKAQLMTGRNLILQLVATP